MLVMVAPLCRGATVTANIRDILGQVFSPYATFTPLPFNPDGSPNVNLPAPRTIIVSNGVMTARNVVNGVYDVTFQGVPRHFYALVPNDTNTYSLSQLSTNYQTWLQVPPQVNTNNYVAGANVTLTTNAGGVVSIASSGSGGGTPILAGTNIVIASVGGSNQINVPTNSFDYAGAAQAATNALNIAAERAALTAAYGILSTNATNFTQASTNALNIAAERAALTAAYQAATNTLNISRLQPGSINGTNLAVSGSVPVVGDFIVTNGASYATISNAFFRGGTIWFANGVDFYNISNLPYANYAHYEGNNATLHFLAGCTNAVFDESTNALGIVWHNLNACGDTTNVDFTTNYVTKLSAAQGGIMPYYQSKMTNRHGIKINLNGGGEVSGSRFYGFGGAGVIILGTNLLAPSPNGPRCNIHDIITASNFYGVAMPSQAYEVPMIYNANSSLWQGFVSAEYTTISGMYSYKNGIDLYSDAGNCSFPGAILGGGDVGFGAGPGNNGLHENLMIASINHNAYATYCTGTGPSQIFQGINFLANDNIFIDSLTNVTFKNNYIGGSAVNLRITNSAGSHEQMFTFQDNLYDGAWGTQIVTNGIMYNALTTNLISGNHSKDNLNSDGSPISSIFTGAPVTLASNLTTLGGTNTITDTVRGSSFLAMTSTVNSSSNALQSSPAGFTTTSALSAGAITGTTVSATTGYTGGASTTNFFTNNLPVASTTIPGAVKVDGSTITISGGVISAVGGGSGPVAGTNIVVVGSTVSVGPNVLTNQDANPREFVSSLQVNSFTNKGLDYMTNAAFQSIWTNSTTSITVTSNGIQVIDVTFGSFGFTNGFFNGIGSNLTALNATNLIGLVGTANLGSSTANSTTFLRGDRVWSSSLGGTLTVNGNLTSAGTTGSLTVSNGSAGTKLSQLFSNTFSSFVISSNGLTVNNTNGTAMTFGNGILIAPTNNSLLNVSNYVSTVVGTGWTNSTARRGMFYVHFGWSTTVAGTASATLYITNYDGLVAVHPWQEGGLTGLSQSGTNWLCGKIGSNSSVNLIAPTGTVTITSNNIDWE